MVMKKRMCILMAMSVLASNMTFAVNAEETQKDIYTVEYNETDEFYKVTNPNNGKSLSYTSAQLLEVEEDDGVYAFKDLDKDGELDIYEDWRVDSKERAKDLASKLSLEQAAGLLLHSLHTSPADDEGNYTPYQYKLVTENNVRTMLYSGKNESDVTTRWVNNLQAAAEKEELGIPMNFSSDPRNLATDVETSVATTAYGSCWPSNLGIAATFNPEYAFLSGQTEAQEYRACGLNIALGPQIDLATEPRWRRYSGTWGENSTLTSDMAKAYVEALQSTWDKVGTDAQDQGWGKDSVIGMVKHFPGDGMGEAGRESHRNSGKYAVYPGNNMAEHYSVFESVFHLDTLTESAKAVMPSYSVAYDEDGPIGAPVASGYNSYKLNDILQEQMGFDGVICTDWCITADYWTPWGVENLTQVERYVMALENGMTQFGGDELLKPMMDAYTIGSLANTTYAEQAFFIRPESEDYDGSEMYKKMFYENAEKILYNSFLTGVFEDPYVSSENAAAVMTDKENAEIAYEAQLDSVILLKNSGQILNAASDQKKTVYMPMEINKERETTTDSASAHASGDWSHVGYEDMSFSGAIAYSFDWEMANEYFNVVTDEIREGADLNALTEEDIIRRTDFSEVDFALVSVEAPHFMDRGFDDSKVDLDNSDGSIDNGYYPISLIYNDYTANPEAVREYPIAVDPEEEVEWMAAGGERGRSRYYGGKTTKGNTEDLNLILNTKEKIGELPLVVYVTATNPFCLYEFEEKADGIVLGLGVSGRAALENISGNHEPQGLLPMQLPANMDTVEQQKEDVPFDLECHVDTDGNTYDFAYGLNWSGQIQDERTAAYTK